MKALALTTDAVTMAPRISATPLEAKSSAANPPSRREAEDATEVLREAEVESGVEGDGGSLEEAKVTAATAASADEFLLLLQEDVNERLPVPEDVCCVGSLTTRSSAGLAEFRM